MGSSASPAVLFDAVVQAASFLDPSDSLVAIGREEPSCSDFEQVEFYCVSDEITMEVDPLWAVRHQKGASLTTGIRLLQEKQIDGFVSAGNTGALIASSALQLRTLPGVSRPALIAALPTEQGSVAVIDVGGNISYKAHHLMEFACMGAAYQRVYEGIEQPTVGLLNIGTESKKGTAKLREAYHLLEQKESVHFVGNVEGREVFEGKVDVLVTDGFTGNVFLKAAEGVSSFIFTTVKKEYPTAVLDTLEKKFHHAEYPGALVCGVEGVVVKCHGDASTKAMLNAIKGAVRAVRQHLVTRIKEVL